MNRHIYTRLLLPATLLAAIYTTAAVAQIGDGHNVSVVVKGLQAPRGLRFGPDGMLYVAEAGTGGTVATTAAECQQVPGPVGPYFGGSSTGRISRINVTNGSRTTVASGFPSTIDSMGDLMGVADVAFLNGQLYALTGGGGCSHGNPSAPNVIAKVNTTTGAWSTVANLSSFIQAHPTDYPNPGDFEPDGSWYSMIAVGDRLFAVEPNRGEIISSDVNGNLRRDLDVSRVEGHIVPTALAEKDGYFYLGNLNLFPIVPNTARVLTFYPDIPPQGVILPLPDLFPSTFKLDQVASKPGFTTITAVDFGPDGNFYVLELSAAAGNPTGGAGKVVRVFPDGLIQEVASGLTVPTGMTFGPDGNIYVSNFGAAAAGAGQIVRITLQSHVAAF